VNPSDKPAPPFPHAKEAMADFYQELLSSLDKSPLEQLAHRDSSVSKDDDVLGTDSSACASIASRTLTQNSSCRSEARARQLSVPLAPRADRTVLVEPLVTRSSLSLPVLQDALPKLAPAVEVPNSIKNYAEVNSVPAHSKEQESLSRLERRNKSAVYGSDVVTVVTTRKGSDPDSVPDKHVDPDALLLNEEKKAWCDNGRPQWAQDRFDCLFFVVAGLTMAVPLVSLGAIYRLDGELTPLVGRASWFMGLYRQGERSVQVVDTAQWVMPDRWSPDVRMNYRFVIRLGDDNWAVAADSVKQLINLRPDQVKWRTDRSKRPWLAGTVVEHMCVLLDVDRLSEMLSQ